MRYPIRNQSACCGLENSATIDAKMRKITEPKSGIRVITNAMTAMSAGNGRWRTRWRKNTTAALMADSVTDPSRELPTDAVTRSVILDSVGRLCAGAREYRAFFIPSRDDRK